MSHFNHFSLALSLVEVSYPDLEIDPETASDDAIRLAESFIGNGHPVVGVAIIVCDHQNNPEAVAAILRWIGENALKDGDCRAGVALICLSEAVYCD